MKNKKYKIFILIIVLTFAFLLTIRNFYFFDYKKDKVRNENKKIIKNLDLISNDDTLNKNRIIFFIDYEDFSCIECENQVLFLIRWIEQNLDSINLKVLLLIRKRYNNERYYEWLIGNWQNENKISLPLILDNNKIFEKLMIPKSSIVIFDRNNSNLIEYKEFPMTREELKKITKKINHK